ncbi:MAG: CmcJ/NvfI family oxidoreductase [Actinomycetota bacterium]
MTPLLEAEIRHATSAGERMVPTVVHDGRQARGLDWRENGFELRVLPTAVEDWDDPEHVAAVYQPEVAEFARAEVGCDLVLFYPTLVRSAAHERAKGKDNGPIEAAHTDYSEQYESMFSDPHHPYVAGLRRSLAAVGADVADLGRARRILTLQLWRNIGEPRPDRPLALCDCRTVDREEFEGYFIESYAGIRAEFESMLLRPPEGEDRRAWYTFPDLRYDEVLLFRAFDSDRVRAGQPFWTPHTAFVDPTAGPDAPGRVSAEIRAICFFLD